MKAHAKLLLLLSSAALALVLYLVLFGAPRTWQAAMLLGAAVLLLLTAAVAAERMLYRLRRGTQALSAQVQALQQTLQEGESKLKREAMARAALDEHVRELHERYSFAVERANDGLWEWDLVTDSVQFSPRWQGMLGYTDNAARSLEEWKRLIHSEDREAVSIRLSNCLEALTPRFEAQYRLRRLDGDYVWVHSRGIAIRSVSGKPYRMVVMDNNIHARKQLEDALVQAAEGLSSVSGVELFRALMRSLAAILGTRDNMICHCVGDPPTRARALAYYKNGTFRDEPLEYELAGTSCGDVITRGEIVYCPTGVCDIWPIEKQYDRDSYLGVPMFDSSGKIIGHFACMDGRPMQQDLPHLALFKIFSVRAAAELERMLLQQHLSQAGLDPHI